MSNYVKTGALDWRAFDGARASGISYLLADGRSGEIIDPTALRCFYTRIYYNLGKAATGVNRKAMIGQGAARQVKERPIHSIKKMGRYLFKIL